MHEDPLCEEPVIGLSSGGERLAGDVDWAHPEEHLWRVRDEEGHTYYGCLWRTSMEDCVRRYLPRHMRTGWGNYDLWDFVNVHATYPLCGWIRSELAMHVTRPVSRMGIIVQGRFSAGVVLALRNPEWQKGRKPHNSRAASCERMHPNLGNRMVP